MIAVKEYVSPEKLSEALDLMSSGEFTPLAGGTDLLIIMRDNKARKILDLGGLKLDFINDIGDKIEIGAGATHSAIANNKHIAESLPALGKASSLVGSKQVRNRGTIGGNIVNASPCADTVPALLLYDAELILKSARGERSIPLTEFISESYKTILRQDEIVYSIFCRKQGKHTGWSYTKLGRRQAVNISRMTLAVSLSLDGNIIRDISISAGSVFPKASRIPVIEDILNGQKVTDSLFETASRKAAELMIRESGPRWSTPYKEPVLIGLLKRTLKEATGYHKGIASS